MSPFAGRGGSFGWGLGGIGGGVVLGFGVGTVTGTGTGMGLGMVAKTPSTVPRLARRTPRTISHRTVRAWITVEKLQLDGLDEFLPKFRVRVPARDDGASLDAAKLGECLPRAEVP